MSIRVHTSLRPVEILSVRGARAGAEMPWSNTGVEAYRRPSRDTARLRDGELKLETQTETDGALASKQRPIIIKGPWVVYFRVRGV